MNIRNFILNNENKSFDDAKSVWYRAFGEEVAFERAMINRYNLVNKKLSDIDRALNVNPVQVLNEIQTQAIRFLGEEKLLLNKEITILTSWLRKIPAAKPRTSVAYAMRILKEIENGDQM